MLGQALADDPAREHVEDGEQRGRAMAFVVVGHRPGAARLYRQAGLGTVEGLDLGLFVHAEHDRLVGRAHVQPDHVDELLLEAFVGRELESLYQVRLELSGGSDPLDCRCRDPDLFRHVPAAPVRLALGLGVLGEPHDLFDFALGDGRLAATALADFAELGQTFGAKARTPLAHRGHRDAEASSANADFHTAN